MKHQPATPLRLVTADEVRKWPAMEGRYFLAVTDPEHAARLFNRDNAYPRLVAAIKTLLRDEIIGENSDDVMTLLAAHDDAEALLRELGEVE